MTVMGNKLEIMSRKRMMMRMSTRMTMRMAMRMTTRTTTRTKTTRWMRTRAIPP
jgi:hypothetical protein